jgi:diguanylate cyclase (GGDEF)-like protein
MPKNRKPARKMAATLRVASVPSEMPQKSLRRFGSLLVVQGAEIDLGRHVVCDHPIIIGRDERVDLSLNDGSISRAHCSVERDPESGDYVLVDLGSTNGTTLNGKRVKDRIPLDSGDKIFLGSSVIRFSKSDEVDLEYQNRLEEMVSTDALTGLVTKRQYDSIFEVVSDQARAQESALTVFVMDMDGLKQINDTHGHEMGSFAISETGKLVREVLDPHGHLARFGGDEFVACFPLLEYSRALELAEELRKRVDDHRFCMDGIEVHPTLSIGVATYPSHIGDPADLFKAADEALYRAKRAGKNRVEGAS